MTSDMRGLFWCSTFLILDAVQAVFCGGIFQRMDSFLIGAIVFGTSAAGCILWTGVRNASELTRAFRAWRPLVWLNVTAAGAWLTYLIAIQLIEPAVAFTIFSGVIPIAAAAAHRLGIPWRRLCETLSKSSAMSFLPPACWRSPCSRFSDGQAS